MVRVEFIDKCAIVLNKNRAKWHAGGKLASNTIDSSDEDFLRTEFLLAACTVALYFILAKGKSEMKPGAMTSPEVQ